MKRFFALVLTFIFFSLNNLAFAVESWEFTAPVPEPVSGVESVGYAPMPDPDTDSYSGKVETYSTVNTTPVTTPVNNTSKESFSEKHPVLTGIGLGVLALGIVGLAIVSSGSSDSNYKSKSHHKNSRCDKPRCSYRH